MAPAPDPPALRDLIPHGGPARLLESLVERQPGSVVCQGRIPAGSPFAEGGRAPSYLALEMAAQAAAVLEALRRSGSGAAGPRVGYLVAVREARLHLPEMEVETAFRATVREAGQAPPLGVYEFRVERDGRLYATGTLSTFLTP
jgi:predicted hotdog family 3-hydroxylacyl-ACP dehydratase